jgi:two-component system sensor histidine kinase CpxA
VKGGLYAKVLIALVVAVLTTTLSASIVFRLMQLTDVPDRFEKLGRAHAFILSEVVVDKWIQGGPAALNPFLEGMAKALDARLRLIGPDGTILASSSNGSDESCQGSEKDLGNFRIKHDWRRSILMLTIPIMKPPLTGSHIQLVIDRTDEGAGPLQRFLTAMLITGAILALMAIPLSRKLTSPLKELRESAHHIAEGDLSSRADVRSHDEIGALAKDFNRMAERVQAMVMASRHLLAHVSHELRSPLARIRILAGMIEDEPNSPQTPARANSMQLEIEDMDRLIGAILDFSRAGMLREQPVETLDLAEELHLMLKRQDPLFREKNIELEVAAPESGTRLPVRRQALRTLLGVLLDNAARFAPDSSQVKVWLYGTQITIENGYVRKEGDESTAEELMKPFHRASDVPGYGLGLAQAKAAADALGATLTIERDATRFRVTIGLPLTAAQKKRR